MMTEDSGRQSISGAHVQRSSLVPTEKQQLITLLMKQLVRSKPVKMHFNKNGIMI